MMKPLVGLVGALALSGCGTQFMGEAQFPRGVAGCQERCAKDGLEMGAFVYLGEYTSGCVCERKVQESAPASAESSARRKAHGRAAAQAVAAVYQTQVQRQQAAAAALGVLGVGETVYLFF